MHRLEAEGGEGRGEAALRRPFVQGRSPLSEGRLDRREQLRGHPESEALTIGTGRTTMRLKGIEGLSRDGWFQFPCRLPLKGAQTYELNSETTLNLSAASSPSPKIERSSRDLSHRFGLSTAYSSRKPKFGEVLPR
jgi:hypothetical protein